MVRIKHLLTKLLIATAFAAAFPLDAAAKTTPQQRMHNRLLLAKARAKKPASPPVIRGSHAAKAALRAQNRAALKRHPEWFTFPRRGDTPHLRDGTGRLANDWLHTVTERVIERLQAQLGKPYVWGGETPEEGFDCSGLVYYAFNPLLAAKLPRTANEMYHYPQARRVADGSLRRGDLLFFAVHTRDKADHMGVYLGDGRFIESPRTGKHIRISSLTDAFWQAHYMGGRRILLNGTVR